MVRISHALKMWRCWCHQTIGSSLKTIVAPFLPHQPPIPISSSRKINKREEFWNTENHSLLEWGASSLSALSITQCQRLGYYWSSVLIHFHYLCHMFTLCSLPFYKVYALITCYLSPPSSISVYPPQINLFLWWLLQCVTMWHSLAPSAKVLFGCKTQTLFSTDNY